MDTRPPIPLRPPLQQRDRGARLVTLSAVEDIVDAALIRAQRGGALVGALTASFFYVIVELARPFL